MVRKNWYYNVNENNVSVAINVSSVIRFYPGIRKIGIFLAFYRDNQFINAECWIDENSNSFESPCFENDANLLDDENLEVNMADWLDKRAKVKDELNFCSVHYSIKTIEELNPDLFNAIKKFVWDEVYS